MKDAYQRLREGLPARRLPDANAFPTDPRRIKAWADALPRANHQSTLRQLVEALEAMRGLRLDGPQRLAALETLRPLILDGMALLDRSLQGSAFPLPPLKAQIAEQIQSLHRELALAYRLAVVELCAPVGSVPFLKGGLVAQALERAIHHCGRDLAVGYFLYRTPAVGSWLVLNALFAMAQSLKLDDKSVDEPAEATTLSPRQVYVQALLLALSNPYRFSQREQAELWPIARDLAAHIELHTRQPGDDAFALALSEDRGPGYLPEERIEDTSALLWLDLAPVRAALEGPLQGEGGGAAHIRFRNGRTLVASADLLRRLRSGWVHAAARSYQRLHAAHLLDTVIGLSGLHFFLAGNQDFDTFMRQVRGVGAHGAERDRAAWASHAADAGRVASARARVLDQSLGGYRISWGAEQSVKARVGELVGISVVGDDDERDWMVGVIRWLRYDRQGEIDAGIELLARRARAVGLRCLDRLGVPRPPLRAIQIQSVRGADNAALHFLAPSLLDAGAARIEIARAADPDDFEGSQDAVSECDSLQVLENSGDYVLVTAQPAVRA